MLENKACMFKCVSYITHTHMLYIYVLYHCLFKMGGSWSGVGVGRGAVNGSGQKGDGVNSGVKSTSKACSLFSLHYFILWYHSTSTSSVKFKTDFNQAEEIVRGGEDKNTTLTFSQETPMKHAQTTLQTLQQTNHPLILSDYLRLQSLAVLCSGRPVSRLRPVTHGLPHGQVSHVARFFTHLFGVGGGTSH